MREHSGQSLAIAGIAALGYAIWAAVLVVLLWLAVTIYAIVKWIGAPEDHASPLTVFLLMVGNITLFVLLLTLALYLIGKPMRYGKRKQRDAEQLALALDDTAPSS